MFGIFVENIVCLRGFWRIPYLEKVVKDLTQLFRIGFPVIFYMDLFSPGFYSCFLCFLGPGPGPSRAWPGRAGPGPPRAQSGPGLGPVSYLEFLGFL